MKPQKHYKVSSKKKPCTENNDYNYYRCVESHFYKKRGCQYPWNIYKDLDVPRCDNFTEIEMMLYSKDGNKGYNRHFLGFSERWSRTQMQCPYPCRYTKYTFRYGKGTLDFKDVRGISGKSIQIGFSDFVIHNWKEYLACDFSCVIGQLGGNLGFFLGGSILAGFDLIIYLSTKFVSAITEITIRKREG